jgi:hypothetical protein
LNISIPISVFRYDKTGQAREWGASASTKEVLFKAYCESWHEMKQFKRLLSSPSLPLQQDITADQIYSRFFRFIYAHVEKVFKRREPQGTTKWVVLVQDGLEFVVTCPEGWGAIQQRALRKAAVEAGLVSQHDVAQRLHFVSEREALKCFVLQQGIEARDYLQVHS